MLELFDQAHGLGAYAGAAAPTRLMPVPAMGAASHRLLWLLARRLARQGETVVVLDGLADEAGPGGGDADGARAGLAGALAGEGEGKGRIGLALPQADEVWPGVHIVPARQGLLRLANQASQAGIAPVPERLRRLLPQGCCLLLTASADVLAVCLQGTAARPLVALEAAPGAVAGSANGQPRALVEAYNAVKVLLQAGELRPVLLPMAPAAARGGLDTLDAPVQALAHCARTHLDEDLQIWPLAYDDERPGVPGERVPEAWWFKVLDSALAVPVSAVEPDSRRS